MPSVPKPPVSPPPAKPRRVKRKNVKRSKREWERAYGSKQRVEWVKSQPCVACWKTPCENAHIVTGGMGRKADYDQIVPLCRYHHRVLHNEGLYIASQLWHRTSLVEDAAHTAREWRRVSGEPEPPTALDRKAAEYFALKPSWLSASKPHISEREGRAK